jgi:alkaline phosphatase
MAHFLGAAIVPTSRVAHATPAAYAVHIKDRALDNEIMDVDVLFGVGNAIKRTRK